MLRNGDHVWDPAPRRSRVLTRVPCSRASSRTQILEYAHRVATTSLDHSLSRRRPNAHSTHLVR
eukprot:373837-Prymnesium_polylepis.1